MVENVGMTYGRYQGLSTDAKPTNATPGSEFYSTDTGTTHLYANGAWVAMSAPVATPYSVLQAPQVATGSGAIAETIQPAFDWEFVGLKLHLNAVGASGNLTVTEDANAGAAYDVVHLTSNLTAQADLTWFPETPIPMVNGDKMVIAWANAGGKTFGLQVYYARRY